MRVEEGFMARERNRVSKRISLVIKRGEDEMFRFGGLLVSE